jgi:endonuclease YncB( thermonuclease family)
LLSWPYVSVAASIIGEEVRTLADVFLPDGTNVNHTLV